MNKRIQDKVLREANINACAMVCRERDKAVLKHPYWPTDIFKALAIVSEEAGELAMAVNDHQYKQASIDNAITEAAQTAAVCIRFIEGALRQKAGE